MNGNIVQEADDVADSTDWLTTPLSGLTAVESALRCEVCKDFYKTPMLTSCNHTFCSMCIRRALSNDGKCPLCRTSEQELKLRSNWSMEEVVASFIKARPAVLEFARKPVVAERESPKRKLEEIDDGNFEPAYTDLPENKRPRMSTRSRKTRGAEATAAMARQEADVPDYGLPDQNDYVPESQPDDGLAECPICWARMKPWQVYNHLDTSCPGSPQPQRNSNTGNNSRSSNMTGSFSSTSRQTQRQSSKALERLPAIHYSMLKEPALRKKLSELGIPAVGSRQDLERRHKEWMTIWNANCDSLNPRRKAELLQDLDVWERTQGARAPTMSKAVTVGAQIKDKDFDGAAWATKHDTSFQDLIASARKSRMQAQQKARESTSEGSTGVSPEGSYTAEEHTSAKGVNPTAPILGESARPQQTIVDLTALRPYQASSEQIAEVMGSDQS